MFVMKMKKTLLALALVSTALSANLMAADIEAGVVNKVVIAQEDLLGAPPEYIPEIEFKDGNSQDSSSSTRAAASGITYFEIGGIVSVQAAYEDISPSQSSTVNDHGGSQVRAYVWQIGYGNVNNAIFNGVSKAPTSTSYRCGSNLHVCSSGETVTGFLYQFDFFGPQNGQLTVSSNSIATPFGYWSDSLYIN